MSRPFKQLLYGAAALTAFGLCGCRFAYATTLAEYRALIAECRQAAEKKNAPESELKTLRARLSEVKAVTYPAGSSVKVNTRALVAALRQGWGETSVNKRFASLEALLTPGGTTSPKGDPRSQAEIVLAGKEFAELRKPVEQGKSAVPNWWVRFTKWAKATAERFAEWLNDMMRDRESPRKLDPIGVEAFVKFLQFLLWFVLAVAVLTTMYLLARTAVARGWLDALRGRKRRSRGNESDLALDLSGDGIPDPLGEARSLAAKGAYREAVRMAYIASLRRLQENGLIVLESNRTNWEYQRDLRRRSRTASDTLLPATRLFDRVWYGRCDSTPDEFSEAVRIHDALGRLPDLASNEPDETAVPSETGGHE